MLSKLHEGDIISKNGNLINIVKLTVLEAKHYPALVTTSTFNLKLCHKKNQTKKVNIYQYIERHGKAGSWIFWLLIILPTTLNTLP